MLNLSGLWSVMATGMVLLWGSVAIAQSSGQPNQRPTTSTRLAAARKFGGRELLDLRLFRRDMHRGRQTNNRPHSSGPFSFLAGFACSCGVGVSCPRIPVSNRDSGIAAAKAAIIDRRATTAYLRRIWQDMRVGLGAGGRCSNCQAVRSAVKRAGSRREHEIVADNPHDCATLAQNRGQRTSG